MLCFRNEQTYRYVAVMVHEVGLADAAWQLQPLLIGGGVLTTRLAWLMQLRPAWLTSRCLRTAGLADAAAVLLGVFAAGASTYAEAAASMAILKGVPASADAAAWA